MQSGPEPKQPQLWCGPLPEWSVEQLPLLVSADELAWGKSLPSRRQLVFLKTRALVRQQLGHWLGCEALSVPLHAPPAGYPDLPAGWGRVSWSHSGQQLLLGWSPHFLGVDLEPADRLVRGEALWLRLCPGEPPPARLAEGVLQRWVALEALIKRRRSSVAVELGQWSFLLDQSRALHRDRQQDVDVVVQRHWLQGRSWWLAWSGGEMPAVVSDEAG